MPTAKGVAKDEAQSWSWYWKSAIGGNIQAQLALVAIYRDGKGVAPDANLANYWQWKAAEAYHQGEKAKLQAEITNEAEAKHDNKNLPATVNLEQCKMPPYQKTGYGYHLSGNLQLLFLLNAEGAVLEASLVQGSSWAVLDHDILNSYVKTCTFKPAKHDGKNISSLYSLQASWTVEP
jgi:hypothetical protein